VVFMVLLDHFCPPLSSSHHWQAFHYAWATCLTTYLNKRLPTGFVAESNVHFGSEIDPFSEKSTSPADFTWQPPPPHQQIMFSATAEIIEVNIFSDVDGLTLKCAIELVSPANKDHAEQRQAFLSKCETYLRQGVSLVVVDVVTARKANLHRDLLDRLHPNHIELSPASGLYAATYHPICENQQVNLDIWFEIFSLGEALPTMPLWFDSNRCLPLLLQETYEQTCRSQRIESIQT
jgi:Protein of unknown function (DUF4058)